MSIQSLYLHYYIALEGPWQLTVGDLAFERGVIFYPGSGSMDGVRGDHVLIAPPFVITEGEVNEVVGVLRQAVLDVWEGSG